ncbi:MAG TPA: tetratricopeptide repeat protein [Burkholderiales bacterium]|jgi:Flp pilus assembly protein TadD|nr:tetratricopeptide repeat protein [Burkholderiales bacterium]
MRLAPLVAALAAVFALAAGAQVEELRDARQSLRSGNPAAALAAVDKHLAGKPQDADARFLRGVILTELARPDEAFDVFLRLTQDFPELPEPYNNLAVLYAARGEYERARASLEMAIRAKPDYATAYENLGDVHARLSSQAYEKAAQLDARNRNAAAKLALARELVNYAPKKKPAAGTIK